MYLFLEFEVYIISDTFHTFHNPHSYDRHIVYVVNWGIADITAIIAAPVSIGLDSA